MDDNTPATKADIKLLMDSIGRLYDANERWKEEIFQRFDVVVEQLRHDVLSAFRDFTAKMDERTNNQETRIRRLEVGMGIGA